MSEPTDTLANPERRRVVRAGARRHGSGHRWLANKEIARRLNISHRTVEIHKASILHKTGIRSVVDLARIVADATEDAPARRG